MTTCNMQSLEFFPLVLGFQITLNIFKASASLKCHPYSAMPIYALARFAIGEGAAN